MNRARMVLPALALAALLLGAVGTVSAASPGYAVYGVQVSYMGTSHSVTVNESLSATTSASYDKLILSVVSGNSTYSYSTQINSSLDVSPFVPSISNQSFTYTSNSTTVSVSVMKNGSTPVQFHGSSYSLTSYAVKAAATSNGTTETVDAGLLTFPSGLIYSVKASIPVPNIDSLGNLTVPGLTTGAGLGSLGLGPDTAVSSIATTSGTATLSVTLLSTSLQLSGPASSATEQVASIGIGAGAVAGVLALGLSVHNRRRHKPEAAPKPEYAVD